MDDLELLKYDLVREYSKCLESIENCKLHIEVKLGEANRKSAPRRRENIESIKQSRDTINKNEKKLIDVRRRYLRNFGTLDGLISFKSREESDRELIIRLDI